MIWSIDDYDWNLPCTVERTAEIQASEISGLLLDKTYYNDVIGTYLKYDIRIEVPFGMEYEYNDLYDNHLVVPASAHKFVLPYAGGMIEVVGRIENIKDIYVRMTRKNKVTNQTEIYTHWKGIQFSVIGNHPTKKVIRNGEAYEDENGQIITIGIPSLPNETDVSVGEAYIYSTNGWEVLEDANDYVY